MNIVAAGPGWRSAPEKNCWGIGNVIFKRPVDLMFDMHDHTKIEGDRKLKCRQIAEMCRSTGTKAYSVRENEKFGYLRYPIELIQIRFKNTRFFSNGICYMIALALYESVDRIDLYGANHMKVNREYTREKPGVDHWLGVAMGMGVDCKVHGSLTQIGKTFTGKMYGYEY